MTARPQEQARELDTDYLYELTLRDSPQIPHADWKRMPQNEPTPNPGDLGVVVANNVRGERSRRKWRQEDLADRLGWSRGCIGHLESGRRRLAVADLPQLCKAFNITMLDLFNGADQADLKALGLTSLWIPRW